MGAGRAAAARIISRVKISADLRSPRRRHTVANDQLALGRGATGSVSARSGALRKPPGHPWTPAPPRAAPRAAEKPHRCSTPAARAAQSQMHVDAGRHAAVAAWPMLHAAGLDTALVELPTGTDPAEVPAQVLRHAIHTAQPLADLVIDHTLSAWPEPTRWAEHTVAASRAAARTIATLQPEQMGRQVTRVATALHIPTEAVTTAVRGRPRPAPPGTPRPPSTADPSAWPQARPAPAKRSASTRSTVMCA